MISYMIEYVISGVKFTRDFKSEYDVGLFINDNYDEFDNYKLFKIASTGEDFPVITEI